jgi:hypothetical protein
LKWYWGRETPSRAWLAPTSAGIPLESTRHPGPGAVHNDGDTYHRFAQVTVPSYTVLRAVPSIALRAGLALAK